ncbi:MAG: family 20 glycosylhydrolase [Pedobacter sp.]|uniref:family 20 glycosylhydrolase n=1 Tax=Pedobacter sp. TaxID=1411316 RepID=UPI0028075062|nr:family 20 glycosylhydrolase [Pedobacter sp.]MDQ8003571.1 family 20 glycosylhydrolase [Pedobacter sp.]
MKQKLFTSFCLLLIAVQTFAQKKTLLQKVNLTWNIIETNHNNSGNTLSELVLTNPSSTPFPAKGWKIYFNSGNPRNAGADSLNLQITHLNGDLFTVSPGKNFKGIAPKQSASVKILSRSLKNITDYSEGFYIVYDSQPSKPVALSLKNVSKVDYSEQEKAIAKQIFEQNKSIKKIATFAVSPILPTPVSYENLGGQFYLDLDINVIADPVFEKERAYLIAELEKVLVSDRVTPTKAKGAKNGEFDPSTITVAALRDELIILKLNPALGLEAYELAINEKGIQITAAKPAGIFYGIQSLKSLMPADAWKARQSRMALPFCKIKDEPRFGHRAFMMDISRNFQPKAQILKVLDVLSFYKINVFHLHFNDDEGWRIAINGLPELTEVGSRRGHTLTENAHLFPSYGSGPTVNNPYGSGHLSRADFIEILKYANARHIKVIPEYETPGHARAAIKAMDARYKRLMKVGKPKEAKQFLLRDLEDRSVYRSVQGFNDNVVNPALPSVYNFIGKIIDETVAMYKDAGAPLQTIHFGGDEVPAGVWEKSPAVKALLEKDKSIENVDELWHYYFTKVNALLKAKNLYLSGWEEIGLKKQLVNGKKQMVLDTRFANENFHTDVWNNLKGNEDLAYKLANAGYKVVLTNVSNMYLDLAYNKDYNEIGQYWGGYVDVDKPFSFVPFDYYSNQAEDQYGNPLPKNYYSGMDKLNENAKANIVGLQAPLWSEVLHSKERFEYLFLPKIIGLAERAWEKEPKWSTISQSNDDLRKQLYNYSWSTFIYKMSKNELPRLNHYAGGFQYRIPTPGYVVKDDKVEANVLYPDLTIRYTVDGSEPTAQSLKYATSIAYQDNMKLRVFNADGRGGRTVKVVR